MRKFCAAVFIFFPFFLQAQLSYNMQLLGRWTNDSLPSLSNPSGQRFNELWGYFDSATSKEYIIMGSIDSIYFFDVSNPASIKLCDVESGRSRNAVNRDFQTYKHYAYAVVDQGVGSLQIFDLQYLPDSVHKVYDSDTLGFRTHTICISGDKMFMASNRTLSKGFKAMTVVSLAQPDSPAFIADLIPPMVNGTPMFYVVHDVTVVNDTAYCSNGNEGLFIYDYRNPLNPVLISAITAYPEKGYNHNSWLTEDGKYMIFTDETAGTGVKLYDIHNVRSPQLSTIFRSHVGAIAHNPFIKGNYAYLSYYHDGVYVFDISDKEKVTLRGFYDTYTTNTNYQGFLGCWGVYPYLPSGNIFASDMSNGMFALKLSNSGVGISSEPRLINFDVYPNPARNQLHINFLVTESDDITLRLLDLHGKELMSKELTANIGKNSIDIQIGDLASGAYILQAQNSGEVARQIVIVN